jgi:hypothetical protein
MARSVGYLRPELGRQARAALVMDHADFSFDATAIHKAYAGISCTRLSMCLSDKGRDAARGPIASPADGRTT